MVRDPSLRHCPSLEAEAGTDIVSVASLAQARGVRTSRGIRHRRKVAGLLARVYRRFKDKRSLFLHHLGFLRLGLEY